LKIIRACKNCYNEYHKKKEHTKTISMNIINKKIRNDYNKYINEPSTKKEKEVYK
jgi:hypothetical protein